MCILECLVKLPADLHTKPHVGQVWFLGRPGRASSSTSSFFHCPCDLRWLTKPGFAKRRRPHTLHFSSFMTSAGTAPSSCFRSARFNSACSTRFHSKLLFLSLMSFLQDAWFFVNASQTSTSILSSFRLFFNTSLNRFLGLCCGLFPLVSSP